MQELHPQCTILMHPAWEACTVALAQRNHFLKPHASLLTWCGAHSPSHMMALLSDHSESISAHIGNRKSAIGNRQSLTLLEA